jgi:hypothetical protein
MPQQRMTIKSGMILILLFCSVLFGSSTSTKAQPNYLRNDKNKISETEIPHASQWKKPNSRYYGPNNYKEITGFEPMAHTFSGPLLDQLASELERPYNEYYGVHYTHRNYIYYDWGF